MTTAINTAVLDHLEQADHAARIAEASKAAALKAEAEKVYLSILTNPSRAGEKDRLAMKAAMTTLGKTFDDAAMDAKLVEAVRERESVQADYVKAQQAVKDAEAARVAEFKRIQEERIKNGEILAAKLQAIRTAENDLDSLNRSLAKRLEFLKANSDRIEAIEKFLGE